MKTTVTLVFAGLLLLASGRLLAQQTFPIYTGTVPDSREKRRSDLLTPSIDFWISPKTQASGPRSSVAGALPAT